MLKSSKTRLLVIWLAIAVIAAIGAHIMFTAGWSDRLELTAKRVGAADSEFPVSLLASPVFRNGLVAFALFGLGVAISSVLIGGTAAAARIHHLQLQLRAK